MGQKHSRQGGRGRSPGARHALTENDEEYDEEFDAHLRRMGKSFGGIDPGSDQAHENRAQDGSRRGQITAKPRVRHATMRTSTTPNKLHTSTSGK